MTTTKKELYETIDLIPDSVAKELLNYADYLASKYIEKTMPEELIIKDSGELKKLKVEKQKCLQLMKFLKKLIIYN